MKDEPSAAEQEDARSEIDLALAALLTGKVRVRLDPATGQVVSTSDGEKSSLTDAQEPPTIS